MFTSSVRRVGFIAPQVPIASFTNSAPRAVASQALSYRSHQRRLSSSKPSNPADGSNGVAAGQNVPAAPSQRLKEKAKIGAEKKAEKKVAAEKKAQGEAKPQRKNKRKTDSIPTSSAMIESDETPQALPRNEAVRNLPSVPSTHHIAPSQIAAANFFSLHRPISITMSIPQPVTDAAFATIFKPGPQPSADVLRTLTNTLQNLDKVTGHMKSFSFGPRQSQWNSETDEIRAAITSDSYRKAETKHLDDPPEDAAMDFPRHILSGDYQPFHPPPAPVPQDTLESLAAGAEAAESQEPEHRRYTAWLTIDVSTNADGEATYVAHSSPLKRQESIIAPKGFLERMQIRQERSKQRAEERAFWAISVRRQRKLKMKKHKYKKLMRRTRTLRRKLDRN